MRALLFVFASLIALSGFAQIYNPVKWAITLTPAGDGNYTLLAKATIDEGWWVYSQYLENEDGPIATTVNYDEGGHFKLVGKNKESDNAKKMFDKVFEMQVTKFQKYYTIEQKIKVTDPSKPITGYVNFMTCNDERCLPPTDVDFELFAAGGSSGDADKKSSIPDGRKEPPTNSALAEKNNQPSESGSEASAEKKKITEGSSGVDATASPSSFSNTTTLGTSSGSKIFKPVNWTFRSEKKGEGLYAVIAEAKIDDGWNIYGPGDPTIDGPVPTNLLLATDESMTIEGNTTASSSDRKEGHDRFFNMNLVKFKKDAILTQLVKAANPAVISGSLEFMACDETKCLPPDFIEFKIDLNTGLEVKEELSEANLKVGENGVVDQTIPSLASTYENPLSDCGSAPKEDKGNLWWMLIFGMINGLVALLTPCVFPMIPLTVSFFTKDTKRKGWQNGMWYGISIILIYVVLGLLITVIFGAGSLNELSTDPIANTLFFVIFIFFAFSFFGYYEITLPSSWSNKSDALADKGGFIGIFFMAATLAIVSFSCTGPLIGTALVEASSKGFLGPLVVMFGFSFALAIPFGLFAAFPAWLNSLPKSGGWMNSVKVLLGFAELALAFKFLSVADMTAHWGILRYELFMGLWVIVALGMAAYLFGLIRFPHDNPGRRLSPIPAMLGLLFALLGVYLATGLFGSTKTGTYNALSMMSGLAPPAHYNFFKPVGKLDEELAIQFPSLAKCANNFDCFHDYYEGLNYARQQNKPILLDFTGYGCVNCRKTEEHIWSRENIRSKITEEFVLISLYVDDKMTLDTVLRSAVSNERIRTVGQIWKDFQVANFQQNSQPLYVIVSPDEKVLTTPRGYDPNVKGYNHFLECGLEAFREWSKPAIGSAE